MIYNKKYKNNLYLIGFHIIIYSQDYYWVYTYRNFKGRDVMSEENKKKNDLFESFNIISSGSLSEDIQKMDMKLSSLPDIEVREVVIKETGNFLNLPGNIINIPIEMIVSFFYTTEAE